MNLVVFVVTSITLSLAAMGWKQFFASVIDSLAWPAAIAFIVYLLREPLRRVIRGLRKVGYRGLEAEFGDYVQDAEIAATQAELPPAEEIAGELALSTELRQEISTAPRAAVIEAWLVVERELEALAEAAGVDPIEQRWTSTRLVAELRRRGVIDPFLATTIGDLGSARDVAAHAYPYTVEHDEVVEYVQLAGRVRDALREAKERLRNEAGPGP